MSQEHAHETSSAPPEERGGAPEDGLRQLQELRAQQALVQRAREQELQEQRKHDAEAQRLMETDPGGHIEIMRSMQDHAALVRELPEELLAREAAAYGDVARGQEPLAPEPLAK